MRHLVLSLPPFKNLGATGQILLSSKYTSPNKDVEDVLKIIYHSKPSPLDGSVDGGVSIQVGTGPTDRSETDDADSGAGQVVAPFRLQQGL